MHRTALVASLLLFALPSLRAQDPVHFEAPLTHAAELSPSGDRLFTVDADDARLCVWSLADPRRPVLLREIVVGLGPVAVRARTDDEVWVVNFASDCVQIVSIAQGLVLATIPTADEPGDVVFAGAPQRAFVATGTDRKIQVFDALTHARIGEIALFADDPRSLCVSEDGTRLWVAAHRSGNGTTLVPDNRAPAPPPPINPNLPAAPRQGILVRHDDPLWRSTHGVVLPDLDVFEIDANTRTIARTFTGVGTILFDVAKRPGRDELWVANTEARNLTRFISALRGHAVDNRVTKIDLATATVTPIDLNPGIAYGALPDLAALSIALAQPADVEFAPDGSLAYVAAFGTDRIGVLAPDGSVIARIDVGTPGTTATPRTKRGPRALAHHQTQPLLYVVERIANALDVVDTATRTVVARISRDNPPLPRTVAEGRGFLYDAKLSGNGTMSCASCHVDGTTDNLAWDLGDPAGTLTRITDAFGQPIDLHPMKGPMVTQTLQGLDATQPFHWRGDRPDLNAFNPAFDELMGRTPLAPLELVDFVAFMESVSYMPNPRQNLDRSLPTTPIGASAAEGQPLFTTTPFTSVVRCVDCHSLTTGTNLLIFSASILQVSQAMKVAQLRNIYKRTGKLATPQGRTAGFGNTHDGVDDSVFAFLGRPVFGSLAGNTTSRRKLEAFVLAFDNGTAPMVGHARTLDSTNVNDPGTRGPVLTMLNRAALGDGDVVAHGLLGGRIAGLRYDAQVQLFRGDRAADPAVPLAYLDAELAAGRARLSFLGVPAGEGVRLGVDRDRDGVRDGDEAAQPFGSASPLSCAPSLRIEGNEPPSVASPGFAVVVDSTAITAPGALLVGFATSSTPIFDLVVHVGAAGSFSLGFSTDGRGNAAIPAAIPNDPALAGGALFFQAIVPDACGALGLAASHGLRVVVQPR
ncbi:MAG: hypothetical protein HZB39_11630 [Planctomycetes bacterium]|nr:hypothetical protein [Planctomycetota bacterium]